MTEILEIHENIDEMKQTLEQNVGDLDELAGILETHVEETNTLTNTLT